MVGEVRRRSRRSSAICSTSPTSTTCAATSSSPRGSIRPSGTTTPIVGRCTPSDGDDRHVPLLRDGHRLPVAAEGARHRRRRALRRRRVLHEQLAARGRRLHRQARRRDRHGIVGHPVDPDHRQPGRRSSPCSSARRTSRSRPATARSRSERRKHFEADPRRLPREAATLVRAPACRWASRAGSARSPCRPRSVRRRYETDVAGGRAPRSSAPASATSSPTPRPTRRSASSSATRSARSSRIRRPPRRCARRTTPSAPSAVPRHQLLRDVQPAPRPPRRSAQDADHHDHRDRHRHERGIARVRRHRLRHRLRRDDRRHRVGRHHRPRRRHARGEVGRRARDLPRPDVGRVPEPLHDHRPRQPVGAVEHGGVDRAARRLGRRLSRRPPRRRQHNASSRPRPPRPAGCSTSTTAATSRSYPSANSWYMGANVPGKPRVFLPYVGGVGAVPR